ncbi:hypothetical protein CYY_008923 [Polysphondylium violaceum]|uniref:TLDc domain-containing protein n=1 Tax=Polysphondylium violaceum TaxID=133409 RepID=A0A8J4PMB2_9MYCE|nr:hypothetical protein CYY_008923 [Polysphondylium violaceum]
MIASNNTREDLEKDNSRLQKENWEYKRVGCSNANHNSLFTLLEISNNENDRLKHEINNINQNVSFINKNLDNCNNKIDLLLGKIESLVIVNDSLNTKIENLNQQQYTLKEQQLNSLEKIDSLTRANESLHQQLKQQHNSLESKLDEQHMQINDRVIKTYEEMESCKQDLLFLKTYSIFELFNDWIDNRKTIDFKLLYKASGDDFLTQSFHSACDGKGPTITVIETTDGCVFGGYNSQSWNCDNKFYGDDKCFIFTLVNKHGIKPTKYIPQYKDQNTVGSSINLGPMFEADIVVRPKSSSQSFPCKYIDTTGKGKSTLSPAPSFTIKTIEIYKCK